jgi:hypothetical protein
MQECSGISSISISKKRVGGAQRGRPGKCVACIINVGGCRWRLHVSACSSTHADHDEGSGISDGLAAGIPAFFIQLN